MSRPLRLEYAGALYHVTSRGNEKKPIYIEETDFALFLSLLAEVCQRFNWILHAYCLMTNHYHLVVETPDGNLSSGMRHLNGVYTQRFNRKHTRVGHLFQGRYKAILVEKDRYLLELCRYVVLNPVRASMVAEPGDWPWNSYLAMAGKAPGFEGLAIDATLLLFGCQRNHAIAQYQTFVSQGKAQSIWEQLKQQIYLGDQAFIEKHMVNLGDQGSRLSEVPVKQRRKPPKSLQVYREESDSRDRAIAAAYQSGGYTLNEIAQYFGCHYSTISRVIAKSR